MKGKYIFIGILGALIVVVCVKYLANEYIFNRSYDREWMVNNFNQNEVAFEEAADLFREDVSKSDHQYITFGLGSWGRINLIIFPAIVDPANKIIGGNDLKINSPELNSVLATLGWDNETVKLLRSKLKQTKCDWIRIVGSKANSVEMYPEQRGWHSYSYVIHGSPIPDSSILLYGKPLGDTGFARRVSLDYRSAL